MAIAKPKAVWPITIAAGANDRIDVKVGATSYAATIAAATYYSPIDLLAAVQAALTAAIANGWAVAVDASQAGHVRVTGTAAFQFLFSTGANAATSARDVLGFGVIDTVAGTTVVAPYQHQNGWYADDPVTDDTDDLPQYQRAQAVTLDGHVQTLHYGARARRVVSLAYLQPYKVLKKWEGANQNEAIERLFESGFGRFRWWPDANTEATFSDYALDLDSSKSLPRNRLAPAVALYSLSLTMLPYLP